MVTRKAVKITVYDLLHNIKILLTLTPQIASYCKFCKKWESKMYANAKRAVMNIFNDTNPNHEVKSKAGKGQRMCKKAGTDNQYKTKRLSEVLLTERLCCV